jgi:hypothetical protein
MHRCTHTRTHLILPVPSSSNKSNAFWNFPPSARSAIFLLTARACVPPPPHPQLPSPPPAV